MSSLTPGALTRLSTDLLIANGADEHEARTVAAALVWADTVGRHTQGVSRLEILVPRLRRKLIRSPCQAQIDRRRPGIIQIAGGGGFGHYLGVLAMQQAIAAARDTGVAMCSVADSNYFGAAGYYASLAAEAGMIGLAASNSFAKVAAHGGTQAVLGTNPLGVGIPRSDGRHVLLDMATAAAAGSTIREMQRDGATLPAGTAVDAQGQTIIDPAATEQGALLPFGGAKGFALGLVVEILCGVLSGAAVGREVGSMYHDFGRSGNNGHFLLAIDIAALSTAEGFASRLDMLIGTLRQSGPGVGAVRYPGEARWDASRRQASDGIELPGASRSVLTALARQQDIATPWQ